MEELLLKIQNDSTLMLIVGVSIAVFLVIFLVIVISAMRIKVYKDSYRRIKAENFEIVEESSNLEKELKVYKITDKKNKKEIAVDAQIIEGLKQDTKDYPALQKSTLEIQTLLEKTQDKLDISYEKYESLQSELFTLKNQHEKLIDENTKCRSNNARLLVKLENVKK